MKSRYNRCHDSKLEQNMYSVNVSDCRLTDKQTHTQIYLEPQGHPNRLTIE